MDVARYFVGLSVVMVIMLMSLLCYHLIVRRMSSRRAPVPKPEETGVDE